MPGDEVDFALEHAQRLGGVVSNALWVSVGDAVTSFTCVGNWVKTHPPKQPHNAIRHKTGGQMVKRTFSHDVTFVMSQNNPVGIEPFFNVKASFCFNKIA